MSMPEGFHRSPEGWIDVPDEFNPPFQRALKIKMRIGADTEGIAWVTIDPEIHYGNAWAHGGLACTLADISSGIAIARQLHEDPLKAIDGTIDLKINFLRKVRDGDMTATARVLHLGKRVAVTDVEITNNGELAAKATATYMLSRANDPGSTGQGGTQT